MFTFPSSSAVGLISAAVPLGSNISPFGHAVLKPYYSAGVGVFCVTNNDSVRDSTDVGRMPYMFKLRLFAYDPSSAGFRHAYCVT